MSLVDEIRANAQSDNPLARACRAELAAEGAGVVVPMEIDDDPVLTELQKESKVMQGVFGLLDTMHKFDPNIKPTQEVMSMLNQWQTRTVAKALGINPITSPKPGAMPPQPNVNDEMEMDDGNEEQSVDAPPPPSGAAPPNDTDGMITVAQWLVGNNHDVTEAVAKRIGRKASSLFSLAFPEDERDYTGGPDGYQHRQYDRRFTWIIERAYMGVVKEDEKAARQPAPAAAAQRPPSATQDDVNKMFRGGRGQ